MHAAGIIRAAAIPSSQANLPVLRFRLCLTAASDGRSAESSHRNDIAAIDPTQNAVFNVYGHLMPGTEDQVTDALDSMASSALRKIDPTGQVRHIQPVENLSSDPSAAGR